MDEIFIILVVAVLFATTKSQNIDKLLITNMANSSILEMFTSNRENILTSIREKCVSEEAFENLKSQPLELNSCLSNHLNYSEFSQELEQSRRTGSMDDVFSKYCLKYPQIRQCIGRLETHINLCLDHNERKTFKMWLELAETLKNYMCLDDGNRLAVFVAKGGIKCLQMTLLQLFQCFNDSSILVARTSIGDKECKDLAGIRSCIVRTMQKCNESVPSNVAESVFKFLRKEFQCNETIPVYLNDYWSLDNNDMYIRVGIILVTLVLCGFFIILIKSFPVSVNKLN